jgi:hypothetical protein
MKVVEKVESKKCVGKENCSIKMEGSKVEGSPSVVIQCYLLTRRIERRRRNEVEVGSMV